MDGDFTFDALQNRLPLACGGTNSVIVEYPTIGALTADPWGRKPTIIGASLLTIVIGSIYPFFKNATLLLIAGFVLTVPIYILVTLLFAVYIPELFPTEVRLRASGICNTFGRGATIITPFFVVALFKAYGVGGVLSLMIGLLVVQILVVLLFGIEPKKRRLEDIDAHVFVSARPGKRMSCTESNR